MSAENGVPAASGDSRIEGLTVEGRSGRGRRCTLVDRTGDALARAELERLLAELISADAFGLRLTGDAAGIALDQARFAHVQVGARLYRLIVERDAARLERF
ncbi:MAG: hypothetical protein R3357_02680 [Burkholderiales bacterium]|nr:hypothetical protein [Burkholderiales bacterium]